MICHYGNLAVADKLGLRYGTLDVILADRNWDVDQRLVVEPNMWMNTEELIRRGGMDIRSVVWVSADSIKENERKKYEANNVKREFVCHPYTNMVIISNTVCIYHAHSHSQAQPSMIAIDGQYSSHDLNRYRLHLISSSGPTSALIPSCAIPISIVGGHSALYKR